MAEINGYKITTLSAPPFVTDAETFIPIVSKDNLDLYKNYKLSISDIKSIVGVGGAGQGLIFQGLISSQTNVIANSIYLLNSGASSFNVYLPEGSNGDIIKFGDHAGNELISPTGLGLNPVYVYPYSGETVQGQNQLILNRDNQNIELIFYINRWTIIGT